MGSTKISEAVFMYASYTSTGCILECVVKFENHLRISFLQIYGLKVTPNSSKGGSRYPPDKSLPVDSAIGFPNTYPLNRDLSDG